MAVFLVRHAAAMGRSSWDDADEKRPLTAKGHRQAEALTRLFDGAHVRRILTSPAVRCRDTVAPLGLVNGVDVDDAAELAEGQNTRRATELVIEQAGKKGDSVLCAHGDLIPEILRRLAHHGMKLESELLFAKGSTWELQVEGGRPVSGRYHPPAE